MSMSKKDYIKAAKYAASIPDYKFREAVAVGFATLFSGDNPRFNRGQFLEACNLTDDPED